MATTPACGWWVRSSTRPIPVSGGPTLSFDHNGVMVGNHATHSSARQGMMPGEVSDHAADDGAFQTARLSGACRQAQPHDRDQQRFHI
jgi:hypothetical protein